MCGVTILCTGNLIKKQCAKLKLSALKFQKARFKILPSVCFENFSYHECNSIILKLKFAENIIRFHYEQNFFNLSKFSCFFFVNFQNNANLISMKSCNGRIYVSDLRKSIKPWKIHLISNNLPKLNGKMRIFHISKCFDRKNNGGFCERQMRDLHRISMDYLHLFFTLFIIILKLW
jgi:hypothetical protein